MPVETRLIAFSEPELVAAAEAFSRNQGHPIPDGPHRTIAIGESPDRVLVATYGDGEIVLNQQDLVGALIAFCIAHRIPLPRRSEKSIRYREGELAMVFRLETNLESPEAAA